MDACMNDVALLHTGGAVQGSPEVHWNCPLSFDINAAPKALHLGVYTVQPNQSPDLVERSSSFLSVVSIQAAASCSIATSKSEHQ